MKILEEYKSWLTEARKNVKPYDASWYSPMGTFEPYWMQFWRAQRDAKRRARELSKKIKTVKEVVAKCDLRYIELNQYQRRVKNPRTGKFIDWWKGRNQKMLDASGNYTYYTNEKSIVKQILQII